MLAPALVWMVAPGRDLLGAELAIAAGGLGWLSARHPRGGLVLGGVAALSLLALLPRPADEPTAAATAPSRPDVLLVVLDTVGARFTSLHGYELDTTPTLGVLTVNALVAGSHLMVPIQSSYYALEGTDDLLDTYEKIRARPNPDLQFLGVVITLHDKRTNLARDVREQIRNVFGEKVFSTTISKSVRLEESPAYRQSIFSFAPTSSGALEYYSLSEEVISRV